MHNRNSLLYWLVDVEGIDGVIAGRVIAMDRAGVAHGAAIKQAFPDLYEKIYAAYDGLYEVNNDC